jgi:hypothetical protein
MPLTAVRHVRKMRGGAQAHLLEADDGKWYVVKFRNNPQHRRVLVNEALCATLLRFLKISAPEYALVQVGAAFLAANPECCLNLGTRRVEIEPGWQFGSQYPGDPARIAVYDFLPDPLLSQVANLEDFRAILVFDKWVGNADGRQCVFYRAMVRRTLSAGGHASFVARMIDHGYAFNGPNWDFPESAVQGLYARKLVYDGVHSLDDFEPWLDQIVHFPEEVIDQAWKSIPPDWIEGEEEVLDRLLEQFFERRARVPALIESCREARTNPFPNWSGA